MLRALPPPAPISYRPISCICVSIHTHTLSGMLMGHSPSKPFGARAAVSLSGRGTCKLCVSAYLRTSAQVLSKRQ